MPVVDASVYVALMRPAETGHHASWAWFQETLSNQQKIIAPVIILPEVAAALGRGTGDPALAGQVVEDLRSARTIELAAVTPALAYRAARIAQEQGIRGCDAIYVALADLRGDLLVTLDRQQLERGASVVQTRSPMDPES